ncbi:hydantoinase B/oxoprolinase family protein [Bosea caraganae]|uniref:Hydantoinase B/oxoprolinase family protein n=1 Tax=Bosea caraganae TaxID=2763117 RepID=A0A370KY70_9HYPH|nr:hydantoinase B/oxoprolinase family protein [Bosea caraganae]RDJ19944.1 hydantoinase B/oxoprolinase family protein [Bosea caraganae]RDJ23882.1 hydantoinase B/oxoprolinase family protein [Bosea caraganae]
MAIDGVLLGIFNNYFRAAAEAAGYTLERTAYTTFIKESQDFTTGLITPAGQHFAFPVSIGAQSYIGIDYSTFIESLAPWHEGDIGIANCPFATKGVSTHLPDYHLIKPIFAEGELMGFAWAFIHSSDMGGIVAGSIQPSAYELFQEGLRITPKKLYAKGVLQAEIREFLLSNVRIPDKNWGDLNAVVAALGIAEARVQQAVVKWGIDAVREGRDALIAYAESRTRAIIRTMPDARWSFEDYLEDDFVSDVPVRIKLSVAKDGEDGLHFDFTGSDPQVQAAFNLATNGRHPFLCLAMFGFFRTRDPGLPINAGLIRPFRFTAPEGSVVNASFPAATGVRYALTQLIFTIVQGALAEVLPGTIPAAGAGQATIPAISTVDPKTGQRQVTVIQPMIGGSGGRPWADGVEGCDISLGSLRNTPCEILEHEAGLRVLAYEVIPGSGGAGRFRGGSALRLDVKLLHPNTIFTARGMERTKFQPWGLEGGKAGAPGDCVLNPGTAAERRLGKVNVERLSAGDVISLRTPAGGGYGDPLTRDTGKVLDDVLDGFVSFDEARDIYGVELDGAEIDLAATGAARAARQTGALPARYDFGEGRSAYMRQFPAVVLDELSGLLAGLPPSLRYRGKQVAVATLREEFNGLPAARGWLSTHWNRIEDTLFGTAPTARG